MKESLLECRVRLPTPPEVVFAFLSDPANLLRLTPPWMRVETVPPVPAALGAGVEFAHRVRTRGVTLRWQSRIELWDPPRRFIDIQVRGPFRSWRHEHSVAPADGGSELLDRVRYSVWGGRWVDRWVVRPDLDRMFAFRSRRLAELFGSPGS